MCKPKTQIAVEALRAAVDYNPDTGVFTWKIAPSYRAWPGKVAGTPQSQGYLVFGYRGVTVLCHRAAWAHVHGYWPDTEVDHINRVRTDNRIANLRTVTRSQNAQNATVRKGAAVGLKGVFKKRNKYVARYWHNGKNIPVGSFNTAEEAKKAYDDAILKVRGEFATS